MILRTAALAVVGLVVSISSSAQTETGQTITVESERGWNAVAINYCVPHLKAANPAVFSENLRPGMKLAWPFAGAREFQALTAFLDKTQTRLRSQSDLVKRLREARRERANSIAEVTAELDAAHASAEHLRFWLAISGVLVLCLAALCYRIAKLLGNQTGRLRRVETRFNKAEARLGETQRQLKEADRTCQGFLLRAPRRNPSIEDCINFIGSLRTALAQRQQSSP